MELMNDNTLNEEYNADNSAYNTENTENNAVDAVNADLFKNSVVGNIWTIPTINLDDINSETENSNEEYASYKYLMSALKASEDFNIKIGLVGPVSCGKSAILNSLIEYPICPNCMFPTTSNFCSFSYSDNYTVKITDYLGNTAEFDCANLSEEDINTFLDYGISYIRNGMFVENFTYFTHKSQNELEKTACREDIDLTDDREKKLLFLILTLFSAYPTESQAADEKIKIKAKEMNVKRNAFLEKLNLHEFEVDDERVLKIDCGLPFEMLKKGMVLVDIPGVGNIDQEGIAKAINDYNLDFMLIAMPAHMAGVGPALKPIESFLNSAILKESINKKGYIIPLINKWDILNSDINKIKALTQYCDIMKEKGLELLPDDIWKYSAIGADYKWPDITQTTFWGISQTTVEALREEGIEEEKIIEGRKKALQKIYENSNIKALQNLFTDDFVEGGKIRSVFKILLNLRYYVYERLNEYDAQLKILENNVLKNKETRDNLTELLIDNIQGGVVKDVSELTEKIGSTRNIGNSDKVNKVHGDAEAKLVDIYTAGIDDLKKQLVDLINQMNRPLQGIMEMFGMKMNYVLLNNPKNKMLAQEIYELIDNYQVDVQPVNAIYSGILSEIKDQIIGYYDDALATLKQVKLNVIKLITNYTNDNEETQKDVRDLGDAVKPLVEIVITELSEQIEVMKENIDVLLTDFQQQIISEVNRINADNLNNIYQNMKKLTGTTFITGQPVMKISTNQTLPVNEKFEITVEDISGYGIMDYLNEVNMGPEQTANIKGNVCGVIKTNISNSLNAKIGAEVQGLAQKISAFSDSLKDKISDMFTKLETMWANTEDAKKDIINAKDTLTDALLEYREAVEPYIVAINKYKPLDAAYEKLGKDLWYDIPNVEKETVFENPNADSSLM